LCAALMFAATSGYAETSSTKLFKMVGEQPPIILTEIQRSSKIPLLHLDEPMEPPSLPVKAAIWNDGYAVFCPTPMLSMELYAKDYVYEEYMLDPAIIPELLKEAQLASTDI